MLGEQGEFAWRAGGSRRRLRARGGHQRLGGHWPGGSRGHGDGGTGGAGATAGAGGVGGLGNGRRLREPAGPVEPRHSGGCVSWDDSTLPIPQGPQFEWSGSETQARFTGTQASVHLNGSANWFEAVVDGQAAKVQYAGGDQTLTLATGLASGEHEVSLYRITEAFFWERAVSGLRLWHGIASGPGSGTG